MPPGSTCSRASTVDGNIFLQLFGSPPPPPELNSQTIIPVRIMSMDALFPNSLAQPKPAPSRRPRRPH